VAWAGRREKVGRSVVARDIQCADSEAWSPHRKARRFLRAVAGSLQRPSQQEGIPRSHQREGVYPALVIPEDEIVQGHDGYGRETAWLADPSLQLTHVIGECDRAVRGTTGTSTHEGRGNRLRLAKVAELAC